MTSQTTTEQGVQLNAFHAPRMIAVLDRIARSLPPRTATRLLIAVSRLPRPYGNDVDRLLRFGPTPVYGADPDAILDERSEGPSEFVSGYPEPAYDSVWAHDWDNYARDLAEDAEQYQDV